MVRKGLPGFGVDIANERPLNMRLMCNSQRALLIGRDRTQKPGNTGTNKHLFDPA